ncbi:hypothetical protein DAPPUDRAFT_261375 [Daphnia pulex]|uniref:Uncharacterized protein n=1 Tax=Daphnia pulex TaxID=6669 RepID=E9HKX3_DAPPU|nr:hypothetical protein DAPPUDRAFT_261375 [Daphnia pulex]|eukprot:EFX67599.1 hypothetical protein DAPPUDRAFT_261375 [Daphnia pulex]
MHSDRLQRAMNKRYIYLAARDGAPVRDRRRIEYVYRDREILALQSNLQNGRITIRAFLMAAAHHFDPLPSQSPQKRPSQSPQEVAVPVAAEAAIPVAVVAAEAVNPAAVVAVENPPVVPAIIGRRRGRPPLNSGAPRHWGNRVRNLDPVADGPPAEVRGRPRGCPPEQGARARGPARGAQPPSPAGVVDQSPVPRGRHRGRPAGKGARVRCPARWAQLPTPGRVMDQPPRPARVVDQPPVPARVVHHQPGPNRVVDPE